MRHQTGMSQAETPEAGSFFLRWQPARLTNRRRGGGYGVAELELSWQVSALPGQFLMARTECGPALPRPLSLLWTQGKQIAFLVKDEGLLRARLANAPLKTQFELRGPYGVPYQRAIDTSRRYLLVGGGSGIAPLRFFQQCHPDLVEATVFGMRRADDASVLPGVQVLVEELGHDSASTKALELWRPGLGIIACGPQAMLRQLVSGLPDHRGVYFALEERMGCGYGACQGCVVMTRDGPLRLCRDGPLVPLEILQW